MPKINDLTTTARCFESHLLEKEQRERKLAWRLVAICLALTLLAIVTLVILLPLKTVEIELWSVDKQSGRYEYMTRIKERDIASEEALSHALAASYVK